MYQSAADLGNSHMVLVSKGKYQYTVKEKKCCSDKFKGWKEVGVKRSFISLIYIV